MLLYRFGIYYTPLLLPDINACTSCGNPASHKVDRKPSPRLPRHQKHCLTCEVDPCAGRHEGGFAHQPEANNKAIAAIVIVTLPNVAAMLVELTR